MHLLIILVTVAIAYSLRLSGQWAEPISHRWQRVLLQFLLPPLLLLMVSISILLMGPQGQMVWAHEGWLSTLVAIALLGSAIVVGFRCAGRAWRTLHQLRSYPVQQVHDYRSRYIDTPTPVAAQVGFWTSELVLSRGLLELLTPEQVAAVLVHEQAHQHYRDSFWFFWLGWVYQWTKWLPRSEALWQELLLLRELRADSWAVQKVSGLLLAESLVAMVQSPLWSEALCVAFHPVAAQSRLEERIDALLTEPKALSSPSLGSWSWLLLALTPLLVVPFHY